MAALHEIFEIDKVVVKVCTSLAGGSTIQMLGTCGALAGGIIAIDYVYGRPVEELSHQPDIPADPNSVFLSAEVSGLLADRFVKRYGTIICSHIHRQLMGRTFWVRDQEDYQKLEAAGAHIDSDKCCDVVGNVASWVMEILLEKGGIKL